MKSRSRHQPESLAGKVARLPPVDSEVLSEARTRYPATRRDPAAAERVLKSGFNSAKIGAQVMKGKWIGFPIYTLTLEERSTCPRSCRHWRSCVVPGSRVLTAGLDWVPIETLAIGQRIAAFDEYPGSDDQRRKTRIAVVEKLGRATLPCFEITTDKGAVIASADHLWMARPRKRLAIDPNYHYAWRRTDDLRAGCTIQHVLSPWEQDTSYEAGRLRGFVEGEGCVSTWGNNGYPKTRVQWSQLPGRLFDEINSIAESKGFRINPRMHISGVNSSNVGATEVLGGWREAARFLGTFKPTRLMDKAEEAFANHDISQGNTTPARILSIRSVGDREVVTIQTSTRTMVVEGLASHNCFGNVMHFAERFQAGPALERKLEAEVAALAAIHPDGFVVRLHVLGDFFSTDYVTLWARLLDRHPELHVFGYTARIDGQTDPIAAALVRLTMANWERFAMRFSNAPIDECSTVSIEHPFQAPPDAVICPAQLGKSASCSTCALCWQSRRRVAFLQH